MMLRKWFALPECQGIDFDSPEALLLNKKIIQDKKFLRCLYEDFYDKFLAESDFTNKGKHLELGSGGGFLKEKMPQVITSDVQPTPFLDRTIDAEQLPFADRELNGIYMINVLHHLVNPKVFFREATRCLAPGGKVVMIEPHNSWFGKLLYTRFHYEPFDDRVSAWENPPGGKTLTANNAIPWIIFWRDKSLFEAEFPELRIVKRNPHTTLGYIMSGGLSWRSLVPGFFFPYVAAIDRVLAKFSQLFPIYQTIVLQKQDS